MEIDVHEEGIARTPVAQTMTRPVWEAPEFDMIGAFETKDMIDFMKNIKERIPNPTERCDYLDLWCENMALSQYSLWARDCARAADCCGDLERREFYEGLSRAVLVDLNAVTEEESTVFFKVRNASWGSDEWDSDEESSLVTTSPESAEQQRQLDLASTAIQSETLLPTPSDELPSQHQRSNNSADHHTDEETPLLVHESTLQQATEHLANEETPLLTHQPTLQQ